MHSRGAGGQVRGRSRRLSIVTYSLLLSTLIKRSRILSYGGLTEAQLRVSFELLLKQDDPSLDYDRWVRDCPAPPHALRSYTGINLKSSEQWKTLLVPLFSRNHATVDFFLARVVLPKEQGQSKGTVEGIRAAFKHLWDSA